MVCEYFFTDDFRIKISEKFENFMYVWTHFDLRSLSPVLGEARALFFFEVLEQRINR